MARGIAGGNIRNVVSVLNTGADFRSTAWTGLVAVVRTFKLGFADGWNGFTLGCTAWVGAVMEFAKRGAGTPIPYDAPKRLVISGIYRYCANPMQLSCGLAMIGWAALLQNWWMAAAAAMSVVYSAGIAEWDERQDLRERFGGDWVTYREQVRSWFIRWRPYVEHDYSRLYIAASCAPCRELQGWLESRRPLGLSLVNAEELAAGSIMRMRYEPADGLASEEGVRALGRALEHLHLGWALVGIVLRLPGLWQFAQLVGDASGLGPRPVVRELR